MTQTLCILHTCSVFFKTHMQPLQTYIKHITPKSMDTVATCSQEHWNKNIGPSKAPQGPDEQNEQEREGVCL